MTSFEAAAILLNVEAAREALEMILGHLGFVFDVTEEKTPDGLVLHVHTRDAGLLIGRDGRTIEDLQFLVNRISTKQEEDSDRVMIDVEGYRKQLRDQLIEKVKSSADYARRSGQTVILEPLNSFDRRIVHNLFQNDPEIKSVSPPGNLRLKRISLEPRKKPVAEKKSKKNDQ